MNETRGKTLFAYGYVRVLGYANNPISTFSNSIYYELQEQIRTLRIDLDNKGIQGNDIINGKMDIWQRGISFISPSTGQYLVDRLLWSSSGMSSTVTVTRSTDTPNPNYNYSTRIQCTTTDTPTGTDSQGAFYKMEGYDFKKYFNQYGVLGFYVKAVNKPGVYCITFTNGNFTRSFVREYTVTTAWTFITIPPVLFNETPLTGGSWSTTNGVGLNIFFALSVGTTYQGTPNSWQASTLLGTSNQVNFMDSTSNELFITAICMNPGTVIYGFNDYDFDNEILRCQRYYEKTYNIDVAPGTVTPIGRKIFITTGTGSATYTIHLDWHWETNKRAIPTVTTYSSSTGTENRVEVKSGDVTPTISSEGTTGAEIKGIDGVAATEKRLMFQAIADAEL